MLKDAALEKAVLMFARPKLAPYGELRRFAVNTSECILRAELLLHGDKESLEISQARYRLEKERGETWMIIYDVHASRAWIENAVRDFMPEIRFKLPDFVRSLL